MPRATLLLTVLLSAGLTAGCLPNLEPWQVLPAGTDARVPSGSDAGTRPGVDAGPGAPRTGGPCGAPVLLMAAHHLGGEAGRVLRWQLRGVDGLSPCGDVTGGGTLDELPFALAPVREDFLLVASRSGVQAIDPLDDRVRYSLSRTNVHPNDAFAIDDESRGDRVAGVAWSNLGGSADVRGPIRTVETFTLEGTVRHTWRGDAIGIGLSTALTQSPNDPRELLAMNSNVFAAAEVDPFAGIRREPALVPAIESTAVTSITAGRSADGRRRIGWSVRSGGQGAAVLTNDPWSESVMLQPATCEGTPCDMIHVAVDPTLANGILAICGLDGARRSLLRFDFDRSVCEMLFDPDAAPGLRPSYLAIRP